MQDFAKDVGLSVLYWLMGSIRDFVMSLGWPGLVAIIASGVLLVTLGMRTFKFLESPKGIALTAGILTVAGLVMWWTRAEAVAAPTPALTAAPLAKPESRPQPKPLASKIDPKPEPLAVAQVEVSKPIAKPAPNEEIPLVAFVPEPPVSSASHALPLASVPPVKVVREPKPANRRPVKRSPLRTPGQAGQAGAVPARPPGQQMGHASAGNMIHPGNAVSGQHPMTPAQQRAYARQSELQAMEAAVNAAMNGLGTGGMHPMNGMPHMGGTGHPGGMPHHPGHR